MTTLNTLVTRIAARMGDYLSGAATSVGTATTLIDELRLYQADNSWNNFYIYFLTGANAGQERLVKLSTQATKSLEIDPALPNTIQANDTYELSPIPRRRIQMAISEAITAAGSDFLVQKITTVVGGFGFQQEYALPVDLVALLNVDAVDGIYTTPVTGYSIGGVPGAYFVILGLAPEWPNDGYSTPYITGSDMRMTYLALPTDPANPTDTLSLSGEMDVYATRFVTEYAMFVLHQQGTAKNKTGESARVDNTLAQQHLEIAEQARRDRPRVIGTAYIQTRTYPEQI